MIAGALVVFITLMGGLLAVSQRSIVRAIFGLAIALGGVALSFLLLGSPFVAAMEVLIYIGGITVAMAFGVMLSTAGRDEATEGVGRRVLGGAVAAIVLVCVGWIVLTTEFGDAPETTAEAWGVEAIGRALLDRFNVVFEVLSVVLLLAIIGAITIAIGDDSAPDSMDAGDEA